MQAAREKLMLTTLIWIRSLGSDTGLCLLPVFGAEGLQQRELEAMQAVCVRHFEASSLAIAESPHCREG